jgi:uncharacterized protein YjcR
MPQTLKSLFICRPAEGILSSQLSPGNRLPNRVLSAAEFEEGSKRMTGRKRGGQPGNQNAVTHGRHSASFRAAKRSAAQAMYEETRRKSEEWLRSCPQTDYGAIVDRLRDLMRQNAGRQNDLKGART